jgi:DNA-binding transcriptional regulator YbjK
LELKKLVRQDEDGNYEATWVLTSEQMATLYWFAINELVSRSLATVLEINSEQFEQMKKEMEENQESSEVLSELTPQVH